jgi:hypothetical protein
MIRRVAFLTALSLAGASLLGGCAFNYFGYERRAAWRDQEESACLAERPPIIASAYVQRSRGIDGAGSCGISHPLKVSAFQSGTVQVGPGATLGCPMAATVEIWMQESVQPAALAWFGQPVVAIKQFSSYSCRPRDNIRGEKLSEHAFGNALDIGAFTLADGRTVTVKSGWRGADDEQGFLHEVEATACARFKTVLGPGEPYHGDHLHLDLAHHNQAGTSRYCNPKPLVVPPQRQPYDGSRMASYPPAGVPGALLANPPSDVVAGELSDPFGVYRNQQAAAAPPPPPPKRSFFARIFGGGAPTPPAPVPLSYAE